MPLMRDRLLLTILAYTALYSPLSVLGENCTQVTCPQQCTCRCYGDQLDVACHLDQQVIHNLMLPVQTNSLSLVGSNISVIAKHAFDGAMKLQVLNLSYIGLREWNLSPNTSLPALTTLDITGNNQFNFNKNILRLPNISEVLGVTWSKECANCKLSNKPQNYTDFPDFGPDGPFPGVHPSSAFPGMFPTGDPGMFPTDDGMTFQKVGNTTEGLKCDAGTAPNAPHEYLSLGFDTSDCSGGLIKCAAMCSPEPHDKDSLSRVQQMFRYTCYPLGGAAVAVNIAVVVTIFLSRKLRNNVSMLLLGNLAICDVILGIYTLIVADFNVFNIIQTEFKNTHMNVANGYRCHIASGLFTIGHTVSVTTAVLLTIDKYVSIVHVMNPDRCLEKKHIVISLSAAYIGSILYSLSPYYSSSMSYSLGLLCTFPVNAEQESPSFIAVIAIFIFAYLAMIPAYLLIFLFVKRTGSQLGINRDATLAKNLALVIGSNFVFFTIPMVDLLVNVLVLQGHKVIYLDYDNISAYQIRFMLLYALPVTCLGFNSLLNPFLCAFRRRKFQREFVTCACVVPRLRAQVQRAISVLTLSSRSSINTPQSRGETYRMERHPESQRMRANSQIIPGACASSSAIVLCKARKISDKSV